MVLYIREFLKEKDNMSRNSVTGRSRDIEISFSIEGAHAYMSLQNLINGERQVRVMYQKLAMSGFANWRQFRLTDTPVSILVPKEVLEAYRLTFFIDNSEPVSARIETVLAELEELRRHPQPEEPVIEIPATGPNPLLLNSAETGTAPFDSELLTTQPVEREIFPHAPESLEPTIEPFVMPQMPVSEPTPHVNSEPHPHNLAHEPAVASEETPPVDTARRSSRIDVDLPVDFKITVPTLPPSAHAAQQKLQGKEHAESGIQQTRRSLSKEKNSGLFGQVAQVFGLSSRAKRGKAYYHERSEIVQDEFQDKLSKLENDYNEGYGLNLATWDPETLTEEETAIWLLNLMVNELIAWQKETGRTTSVNKPLVEALSDISIELRQVLKQTRGVTPAPTLFPDLLAENERDLEKIQNECDAYLHRFAEKLIQQERQHASKIEVPFFKKFLTEFVRDSLFVKIAGSLEGRTVPKRLSWFLELADAELIPIKIGETRVSPRYHTVKATCPSEYESGTVAEVVTPGLQSKNGKRVSHAAAVIAAE